MNQTNVASSLSNRRGMDASCISLANGHAKKCLAIIENTGEWQTISFLHSIRNAKEFEEFSLWLRDKGAKAPIKNIDGSDINTPEQAIWCDTFLFSMEAAFLIKDGFEKLWRKLHEGERKEMYVLQ